MGFNIPRSYLYCMGESVLDKAKYSRDSAFVRAQNRQEFDYHAALPQIMRNLNEQSLFSKQVEKPPTATPLGPSLLAPLLQLLKPFNFILAPFRYVTNRLLPQRMRQMVRSMAQTAVQLSEIILKNLTNVVGQVVSFFFGFKKEKKEEASLQDIEAQLIEIQEPQERKVEGTTGANLGGGQQ